MADRLPAWDPKSPEWWNRDARADRLTEWALAETDPARAQVYATLAAAEATRVASARAEEAAEAQLGPLEAVATAVEESASLLVEAIAGTETTDPPEPPRWLEWLAAGTGRSWPTGRRLAWLKRYRWAEL